jgi:hypothetical protein
MALVLKTSGLTPREFESLPLRHKKYPVNPGVFYGLRRSYRSLIECRERLTIKVSYINLIADIKHNNYPTKEDLSYGRNEYTRR